MYVPSFLLLASGEAAGAYSFATNQSAAAGSIWKLLFYDLET